MIKWQDVQGPVVAARLGAAKNPGFANLVGTVGAYHFDASSEEELNMWLQIPHGIARYSSLKPHVHWTATDANTGNVRWGLEYTLWNYRKATTTSKTIYCLGAADLGGVGELINGFDTAIGDADNETLTDSTVIGCRFFRDATDAADTYASDAVPLFIDFHYQYEQDGSDTEIPIAHYVVDFS